MRITVKSRWALLKKYLDEPEKFKAFVEESPLISINDSPSELLVEMLGFEDNLQNVHTQIFIDVEWDTPAAIQSEQAREIVQFADQKAAEGYEKIYVHCTMGISRSGAIGEFLAARYGDWDFNEAHPEICPNLRVKRLLEEQAKILLFERSQKT